MRPDLRKSPRLRFFDTGGPHSAANLPLPPRDSRSRANRRHETPPGTLPVPVVAGILLVFDEIVKADQRARNGYSGM